MIAVSTVPSTTTDPEYKAYGIYIINISSKLTTKDLIAGMQKFGKINSAAIYGGDKYKNYYGYVDFAEKGCAKKCMSQLMSSEEEMKFLNVGEKSLHTYLRYKWKMAEDNPELNGIVTRDYKPIAIANNNYVTAVTTVAIPSTTPNVLAPPFIPATYTAPHGLSNRRSGNLTLENPKLVATTTKGINGAYYPITTIANANPATPAIGGIMPMGMNMNMNMGMTIGMGINRNGTTVNVNPKMAYPNNMYNPNWQNSGRVSNGGRNRSRGNSASNGSGNNGLNHRSSNRSMRSNNGNSNVNENVNDNSSSSTTNTTTASKGMDVTAKEFVMPSKKGSHSHLHVENYYYDQDHHKVHDNNDVKEEEGKEKGEKEAKNTNKPNHSSNNGDLTHGGEEDTIVEEKQSVKEDNTEDNTNDITETASNANEDTTTETHQDIVDEEEKEGKEQEEQEEEKINPTEEDIISSLDQNNETKWGDMKESSALPPLNDLPYTSSTNDEDDKATEDTNNEDVKNNNNSNDDNSSSNNKSSNDNKYNNATGNAHRNKYNSSSNNNYNNKYNTTNNTYHNKYNNNTTGNVYNNNYNNPNGNTYSNNAYNNTNGSTYNNPYNNNYNNTSGNTYNNNYNHYNNNNNKRLSNASSTPSISSDEEELLGPLPEFVSKPITRTKLNISRIPPGMTYDQLYSLFLEHGQILSMTIKPAKIGTVAFLEYATPEEAMEAIRELDDAYAVDEATPIHQIPQNLESLCVDYAYSDGITRHSREGVTPIFIKGLPGNMKRGDLKIICVEFGDIAKTRLSKMDGGAHGIKCSATIEYVRKDCTRMALAYLEDLFHRYGYHTVKVEKYNVNRNSYKPPHP